MFAELKELILTIQLATISKVRVSFNHLWNDVECVTLILAAASFFRNKAVFSSITAIIQHQTKDSTLNTLNTALDAPKINIMLLKIPQLHLLTLFRGLWKSTFKAVLQS